MGSIGVQVILDQCSKSPKCPFHPFHPLSSRSANPGSGCGHGPPPPPPSTAATSVCRVTEEIELVNGGSKDINSLQGCSMTALLLAISLGLQDRKASKGQLQGDSSRL